MSSVSLIETVTHFIHSLAGYLPGFDVYCTSTQIRLATSSQGK